MTITITFVPYGEQSAREILCAALEELSRSTWELRSIKKGDYWKHTRYKGRIWVQEENRFILEADSPEEEGFLLGPFMAWVARHAHQNLWSANVIFGELTP